MNTNNKMTAKRHEKIMKKFCMVDLRLWCPTRGKQLPKTFIFLVLIPSAAYYVVMKKRRIQTKNGRNNVNVEQDEWHHKSLIFPCRYDYVEIADNSNAIASKYCGDQTGKQVVLGGDYAVLTFYSDYAAPAKRFVIIFTVVQPSKSNKKCDNFLFFHWQFVNRWMLMHSESVFFHSDSNAP